MLYLISLYFCSTKYIIYNNFSEYHISEFYKKSFATTNVFQSDNVFIFTPIFGYSNYMLITTWPNILIKCDFI